MKRILIGAGLVVAVAFPAAIAASVRDYDGSVDGGGSLRFETKVRHGQTIKVRKFVFNHVPMECDDGPTTVGDVGTPPPAMKVHENHRFHGDFTSALGRKHVHIRGRFEDHDRKAHGTLRVRGDFGGTTINCDTGKDHWSAERSG